MKKKTRFLLILPLAILVFLGVFWWNFPWEGALRWGLTSAENVSRSRGVAFSCGSSTAQDHMSPLFRCGDLQVRHSLGGLEMVRVEARLRPLSSAIKRGIYLDVRLGPGRFEALTGQKLSWTKGSCSLLVRGQSVVVDDLDLEGDVSAKGSLEVSTSEGRISRAAVELKTPGETETMMQALSAILPLKRVKAGEWRLERK